ncbi:hypothetical protein [Prosthecomicrobium sp. N25]|uniref:hypothetical protein n=1 Tax=Prosthecomicrobium sp. N25 TaxID=3129254 RepID=UPI0030775335
MFSKIAAAVLTATVIAGGSVATATSASAGYFHHHGYYAPHYVYRPYVNYYYAPACHYKTVQIWTYHGPAWVEKKVCY